MGDNHLRGSRRPFWVRYGPPEALKTQRRLRGVFGVLRGRAERVCRDEGLGLGVHPLDVVLELGGLDPPLTPATHLDGGELSGTYERVSLGRRDVENLGDIRQLDEALCHAVCF